METMNKEIEKLNTCQRELYILYFELGIDDIEYLANLYHCSEKAIKRRIEHIQRIINFISNLSEKDIENIINDVEEDIRAEKEQEKRKKDFMNSLTHLTVLQDLINYLMQMPNENQTIQIDENYCQKTNKVIEPRLQQAFKDVKQMFKTFNTKNINISFTPSNKEYGYIECSKWKGTNGKNINIKFNLNVNNL